MRCPTRAHVHYKLFGNEEKIHFPLIARCIDPLVRFVSVRRKRLVVCRVYTQAMTRTHEGLSIHFALIQVASASVELIKGMLDSAEFIRSGPIFDSLYALVEVTSR